MPGAAGVPLGQLHWLGWHCPVSSQAVPGAHSSQGFGQSPPSQWRVVKRAPIPRVERPRAAPAVGKMEALVELQADQVT